jgi:hypothetical protein
MGEAVAEAGPAIDVGQDFRDPDPRQKPFQPFGQRARSMASAFPWQEEYALAHLRLVRAAF